MRVFAVIVSGLTLLVGLVGGYFTFQAFALGNEYRDRVQEISIDIREMESQIDGLESRIQVLPGEIDTAWRDCFGQIVDDAFGSTDAAGSKCDRWTELEVELQSANFDLPTAKRNAESLSAELAGIENAVAKEEQRSTTLLISTAALTTGLLVSSTLLWVFSSRKKS